MPRADRVWHTPNRGNPVYMCVCECMFNSEVKWKEVHASVPEHKHCMCVCVRVCASSPPRPQLFLWGSGSDSCPSGPEQSSHCCEKDELSTLFGGLAASRAPSQQGSVRQAQQKGPGWKQPALAQTAHTHTHTVLPTTAPKAEEQVPLGLI